MLTESYKMSIAGIQNNLKSNKNVKNYSQLNTSFGYLKQYNSVQHDSNPSYVVRDKSLMKLREICKIAEKWGNRLFGSSHERSIFRMATSAGIETASATNVT
jgi:hypothetical protein